jgi:hypothetical protein
MLLSEYKNGGIIIITGMWRNRLSVIIGIWRTRLSVIQACEGIGSVAE